MVAAAALAAAAFVPLGAVAEDDREDDLAADVDERVLIVGADGAARRIGDYERDGGRTGVDPDEVVEEIERSDLGRSLGVR